MSRAYLPAVTQRRTLAKTDQPAQRRLEPRAAVPEWFDELRANVRDELATAEYDARQVETERHALAARLAEAKQELVIAEQQLDPYRPELEAASAEVRAVQERLRTAKQRATNAGWLERRAAGRDVDSAERDHSTGGGIFTPP